MTKITLIALLCGSLVALTRGCNRNALKGSARLIAANARFKSPALRAKIA